jgi:outer membrane protein TolC
MFAKETVEKRPCRHPELVSGSSREAISREMLKRVQHDDGGTRRFSTVSKAFLSGAAIWILLALTLAAWAQADDAAWTLAAAVDYALAHNPDLAERQAGVEVAEEAQQEVAAGFMPQLNLTGGYQYIGNVPEIDISISPEIPIPGVPPITVEKTVEMGASDNWKAEAALSQLVFASGRVYYGYRALGQQVAARRHEVEAVRVKVAQQAAEAHLGVLILQEVYQAQSAALASAQEHLRHVTHRYEAGAAAKFELLRAQVEVDALEPEVNKAAQQIELAKAGFRRVLGLPADAEIRVAGVLEGDLGPLAAPAPYALAEQKRPELAAVSAGERAYENASKSRRGEMLPAVMLTGTYGYQKPYYFNLDGDFNWTAGVGVQIPLFDGLRAYRRMKGDAYNAEAMRRARDRWRADIRVEVEKAALAQDEAARRVVKTRDNAARAKDMSRIAEESYTAGAITSLEVIDAQLAATRARVAYLLALYDHRVAGVRLAAAVGDWQTIRGVTP